MKLPRRALVLGLARSGQAAALALARHGVPTLAVDRAEGLDVGRLAEAGVEVHAGTEEERLLEGVDLLVKSPGVPGKSPLPSAARERGIPIWSEVELGFRLLRNSFLGVTGTNGKTTTCELLGAIFRAAERPVAVAGNVVVRSPRSTARSKTMPGSSASSRAFSSRTCTAFAPVWASC